MTQGEELLCPRRLQLSGKGGISRIYIYNFSVRQGKAINAIENKGSPEKLSHLLKGSRSQGRGLNPGLPGYVYTATKNPWLVRGADSSSPGLNCGAIKLPCSRQAGTPVLSPSQARVTNTRKTWLLRIITPGMNSLCYI